MASSRYTMTETEIQEHVAEWDVKQGCSGVECNCGAQSRGTRESLAAGWIQVGDINYPAWACKVCAVEYLTDETV
jgi:hypothetical protein